MKRLGKIMVGLMLDVGIGLALFILFYWAWQWGCTGQFLFWR